MSLFFLGGAIHAQVPVNPNPTRVLGHARLAVTSGQPNLIEGRELNGPQAVVVDSTANIVYVADTGNHRVLAWRNATGFQNGAPASFVVGQRDKFTSVPLGPGTSFISGVNSPTGLAVDGRGNLYVVDTGNNRVVRYARPGELADDDVRLADFVIGQPNLSSRTANFAGAPTERTLSLATSSSVFRTTIIFDAQGNLWISDAGNNRVLRYAASSLSEGAANGPSANLVLGQPDFRSNTAPSSNVQNRLNKQGIRAPSSIALDQGGRLFVTDFFSRVLVYAAPFTNGMDAIRIMGVTVVAQGQQAPPPINETSLGLVLANPLSFVPPEGVFTIGNIPFVLDTPNNRILRYDPFDQWPAEANSFSPPARATIGQDSSQQAAPVLHRGGAEPTAMSFAGPVSGSFSFGETYIADSGNNRVLVFPDISTGPPLSAGDPYRARRVLGQIDFQFRSPNLIEGREFAFIGAAGIAIDSRSDPPHLYVADTANNRILGFADARRVRPGDRADIVIGQPDCFRSLANYPANSLTQRNASSLLLPIGIAVDAGGNVWVADNGNSRVLRFPPPFSSGAPRCDGGAPLEANVVLGQASFTSRITDATDRTMASPYGIAFSVEGNLLVSDATHNRVLLFQPPFTNGMSAVRAFGQPNFDTIAAGNTDNRLNVPRHIAIDTDDRLYVADAGNNRIMIFSRAPLAGADPRAALILTNRNALRTPTGITVSPITGEIWVTHSSGSTHTVLRFPRFDVLTSAGDVPDYNFPVGVGLALTLDPFNNLLIADGLSRVALHFPVLKVVNGANYAPRTAANVVTSGVATPGMVATMTPYNYAFTEQTRVFNELPNPLPLPTVLGDLTVLVDDVPAPLYFVSPFQINFLVPNGASSSGFAEVQLIQPSTGRVIAAIQVPMNVALPGLFTSNASGSGVVAALNQDNSVHSLSNRIERGQVLQLFGTGAGFIPDAPPDGTPPSGAIETPDRPRAFVNNIECDVTYSGVAPGLVGVWQVNIVIKDTIPPGEWPVVIALRDVSSINPQNPAQIRPTVAVR